MKNTLAISFTLFLAVSCNNKTSGPDVSSIKVDVRIKRFDRDFFSMDTLAPEKALSDLNVKYPVLLPVFLKNILGIPDSAFYPGIKTYLQLNRFIADTAARIFSNTDFLKKEFEQAFRHVKYYFPGYEVPQIVTIIGPVDLLAQTTSGEQTPDFLGPGFLGISLQFYLGKDFPMYREEYFAANIAPRYRSRRFDKKYMVADAMKLVVDDLFPDKSRGKGLAEQMIEKGKQWWLLDKLMPAAPDSVKTGYTRDQLEWCRENEGLIWNSIITNEKNIFTTDPLAIQTYIGDAPFTQTMPPASPGNIGQWVGWQIVKWFVEKNPGMTIDEVMKTDAKKILEVARYKPK